MTIAWLLFAAITFHIQDTTGAWHDAEEWRSSKAVVLAFISIDCPISNSYAPEFQRLYKDYTRRGVLFYGVQPDPSRTPDEVRKYVEDFGYTFPMLLDIEQILTRAAGATIQPQVVVLSPKGSVLYSGRVDDRYIDIGKSRYAAKTHDLRDALNSVLVGEKVWHAKTQAVGCVIPVGPLPPRSPDDK